MKLFLFALISTIFFGTKKDLVENKKFYNHKITDTIKNVDTLLIGDLNSDKIPDTIYRIYPQMINVTADYDGDCVNNACEVTFKFSFTDQQIVIYIAIGAGIENLGDINKDGFSEFSIFPHWYIGCWGKIQYFTFKNNEWKNFGFARANICEETTYEKQVKVISTKKIKVMEVYPNKDYSEMLQRYKTLKLD